MAQGETKNLGQVACIWISSYAPENNKLIWYDLREQIHKVYDVSDGEWKSLNPQIVTNSNITTLRTIALNTGLTIGKFYYLTDVGTLAIVITTTKIWYVDSHSNYIVNDLSASIQAYVNSTNLLIDGTTGIWSGGQLKFDFSLISSGYDLQESNDYVVMRRQNGSAWTWVKARISNLISAVSGNSITWNNGLYFSFNSAINSIKNAVGGVVGYDEYIENNSSIASSIASATAGNQSILSAAKIYTDQEVADSKIYGKKHNGAWTVLSSPPNVPNQNATIGQIMQILVSWVNVLQNANKITLGSGFSSNGRTGNVNYTDTVCAAIEKLVYKLNNQQKTSGIDLPSGFNVDGREGEYSVNDTLNILLEKIIYHINLQSNADYIKLPSDFAVDGISGDILVTDTLDVLLEKLIYKIILHDSASNINLPNDWSEGTYSGTPQDQDNLSVAIGKLAEMCYKLAVSNNVRLPNDFDPGDYNNVLPTVNDTLTSAIGKLCAVINGNIVSDKVVLPSGFNTNGRSGVFVTTDNLTFVLEKLIYQVNNKLSLSGGGDVIGSVRFQELTVTNTLSVTSASITNLQAQQIDGLSVLDFGSSGQIRGDVSFTGDVSLGNNGVFFAFNASISNFRAQGISGVSILDIENGGSINASGADLYIDNIISRGRISCSDTITADTRMVAPSFDTISDSRLKTILSDIKLSVEQIADAPSVRFLFKNDKDKIRVGTIAQYWKEILPEVVSSNDDGYLHMDYGVAALVSSIEISKEIVALKKEIKELKQLMTKY